MNDRINLAVLGAIKSYKPGKPATRDDIWMMDKIRRQLVVVAGEFDAKRELVIVLQRLKKSGAIKYSRKPAGWVVAK